MIKTIIKYLPLVVAYISVLSFCVYGIYFRQKEIHDEYNNMEGVVTSYSISRNGNYMCYIKLDNGLTGTVNNGYGIVKVGDRWHNKVNYNLLFGISGSAYFIEPSERRTTVEVLLFILLVIFPIVGYTIHYFIIFCKWWASKWEDNTKIIFNGNNNRQSNRPVID